MNFLSKLEIIVYYTIAFKKICAFNTKYSGQKLKLNGITSEIHAYNTITRITLFNAPEKVEIYL